MSAALAEGLLEAYGRDGYAAPLEALDPGEANALCDEIAAFEKHYGVVAGHVIRNKGHLKLKRLYDLVADPRLLDPVEAILGPDILCWGSSLFVKEAHDPAYVAWHQDSYYWGLEPHDVCSAWIALKPSTIENGAMRVVPGTHKGPQRSHVASSADSANMLFTHEELEGGVDEDSAVDILLEPGQMSLHHINLLHGSQPNGSDERRMGYAIRYVAAHVRQRGDMDSATLVRGKDRYGNFKPDPVPTRDMEPEIVAFVDAPLGGTPKGAHRG